jgi:carbonic anhydrase/acetyltransferase-like protein (isoleucine patch superfamily)
VSNCRGEAKRCRESLQELVRESGMTVIYRGELVDPTAYVAPNAIVVGQVEIGPEASVWFGCVLRGDNESIAIGARSNVQDLTVIHTDEGVPCTVGTGVTIGHRAVLHGATVGDGALIGIGAIVLNGARIDEEAMVGAGAVVTEGQVIPPRHLALGVPAKIVRELTDAEVERLHAAAAHYVGRARQFRTEGSRGHQ